MHMERMVEGRQWIFWQKMSTTICAALGYILAGFWSVIGWIFSVYVLIFSLVGFFLSCRPSLSPYWWENDPFCLMARALISWNISVPIGRLISTVVWPSLFLYDLYMEHNYCISVPIGGLISSHQLDYILFIPVGLSPHNLDCPYFLIIG